MKKVFQGLIVLAFASTLLVGCGSSSSDSAVVDKGDYLYATSADEPIDFADNSIDNWGQANVVFNDGYDLDADYNPCISVTSGVPGWDATLDLAVASFPN